MIIAILLTSCALAMLAWTVFNLAIYALRFFAGVSAASLAYAHGSGFIGAGLVGLTSGALADGAGPDPCRLCRSCRHRSVLGYEAHHRRDRAKRRFADGVRPRGWRDHGGGRLHSPHRRRLARWPGCGSGSE